METSIHTYKRTCILSYVYITPVVVKDLHLLLHSYIELLLWTLPYVTCHRRKRGVSQSTATPKSRWIRVSVGPMEYPCSHNYRTAVLVNTWMDTCDVMTTATPAESNPGRPALPIICSMADLVKNTAICELGVFWFLPCSDIIKSKIVLAVYHRSLMPRVPENSKYSVRQILLRGSSNTTTEKCKTAPLLHLEYLHSAHLYPRPGTIAPPIDSLISSHYTFNVPSKWFSQLTFFTS